MENITEKENIKNSKILQKSIQGREIAKNNFDLLVNLSESILKESGLQDNVAILTYGSAGGRTMVSISDTDFTIIDDGNLPLDKLLDFQEIIYNVFSKYTWTIAIKSWKRVRVNPMDLLSIRFVCGNRKIFEEQVLNDPFIINTNNGHILISTLAGVDLHLEFMASDYFSPLVRTYHPTKEFPIGISYGDVKYFTGGLRWIQQIIAIAMLYSNKRFLSDTDINVLVEKNIYSSDDIEILNSALDFLLTAKDICLEGNNMLYSTNINKIVELWEQTAKEITINYDNHINKIQSLFYKAQNAMLHDYPNHEGVLSRVLKKSSELIPLIETNKLELWKNIALRRDIPIEIKYELRNKILERQKHSPHTMLDEMLFMLNFANEEKLQYSAQEHKKVELESLWMTDKVFEYLEKILEGNINKPDLIRYAVQNSFFDLYKSNKYPNLEIFYETYFDRVKKFFHCSTLEPEQPVIIAKQACEQILNSGLFHSENITLLELHLTNKCNLNCKWCTYDSIHNNQSIQFDDLKYIVEIKPMEILIAGGGEPTLFKENQFEFNEVIDYLRYNLSGTRIRLITNGTIIPNGDWISKIDEISISLDSECSDSFNIDKGANLFDNVLNNIKIYLYESSVSFLRVTMIYNNQNIFKSISLAENLFSLWNVIPNYYAKKRFFKFSIFPMANDKNVHSPYTLSYISTSQKETWFKKLIAIEKEIPEFYHFLEKNTNLVNIFNDDLSICFADKCWNVTNYLLIGADRKIYPCFTTCSNFNTTQIGHINLSKKELQKSRENIFSFPPLNCKNGCRPSSVFYGLKSKEIHFEQKKLNISSITQKNSISKTIVHVSYQDPEHLIGGIGWAVYNLCKEQIKQDEVVYWISPCIKNEQNGEYLYENGLLRVIKIKFTDETVNTLFANDFEVHKQRIKFGDDVVDFIKNNFSPENSVIHLHGFIEIPRRSIGLRNLGFHVISTFHMLLSTRSKSINPHDNVNNLTELEKAAINENSIITVPSLSMKDELLAIAPDYKGIIHCVKNGIGNEHFTIPFHSIDSNQRIIISYGRISNEKGFDLLLSAIKILYKKKNFDENELLKFIIFGNTDITIESRRIYVQRLLSSINELPNIEILATNEGITGIEKLKMIDKSLFGVIPSLYEPFGMVIPEIMARAKPIITTLTDGAKDILQTNKIGINDFGFIVDSTPESIASAIEWMLNNPNETKQMGQNAFERAKYYNWQDVANQFNELYLQKTR
ncbi:MAG: glycosyltransferase [Chlorobium sp.]|nr:MAG: glycosyltransferase [Chlorobium sp.]